MTTSLSSVTHVRQRFSRSANVERDVSPDAISGYLPTARALDVVRRVVEGLEDPQAGRSISVTGPYGSGKSSLALFLAALLGRDKYLQPRADVLLSECDPGLARRLSIVRIAGGTQGFICAAAVGQREPVVKTVLRALQFGVDRFVGEHPKLARNSAILELRRTPFDSDPSRLRNVLIDVAKVAPLLLVLDEFGKNLEHFAATGNSSDDLFILQEIAEWSTSNSSHPIVLLTLQHLAFEDYAAGASVSKRREWSKIQGRFADVPYVESPAQSQTLIASVFEQRSDLTKWSNSVQEPLREIGSTDLLHVRPAEIFPLHPITAVALPELCARYGQNERTLFSFLAGPDPLAVPEFLRTNGLPARGIPACVRLDRVYDFFLESASTMVSASATASRWLEIETRIRDTAGLTDAELRILKSIAVLNLVSAGGSLRASRSMLAAVAVDGKSGTKSVEDLNDCLKSLEKKGVLTYREYADEYRVWNGSDFDLKGAVTIARRQRFETPVADLLQQVRPLSPIVAARHSQQTGTLRLFERRFVGDQVDDIGAMGAARDGVVLLYVGSRKALPVDVEQEAEKPLVVGRSPLIVEVEEAARELAAHVDVLDGPQGSTADWVAKRELRERAAVAASALDAAIERAFGPNAIGIQWFVSGDSGSTRRGRKVRSLSTLLSDLCDEAYPDSPVIRNEMIARRELTSQAARARRELMSAMVSRSDVERCGIEGFGPERAMYEAVLARTGIHRERSGVLSFGSPSSSSTDKDLNFLPVWKRINQMFDEAEDKQISLRDVYERLKLSPVGLKEGVLPILVTASILAQRNRVALYENGSFVAKVDEPVVERLLRNPELFSLKSFATRGSRLEIVKGLGKLLVVSFELDSSAGLPSIVSVVGTLLGRLRELPIYSRRTGSLSEFATGVRSECFSATEPDLLLFRSLPLAVGLAEFTSSKPKSETHIAEFLRRLDDCLMELEGAFGDLLDRVELSLRTGLVVRGKDVRKNIAGRVSQFADVILDPAVKTFVLALADSSLPRNEWLEYVGMVAVSKPPSSWVDDDVRQFELRIAELSQAIRRLEGLHFDLRDKEGEGFEAVRVGFTMPDGTDRAKVLTIDDNVSEELDRLVVEFLMQAKSVLGDSGREMVLARLAIKVLGDEKVELVIKPKPKSEPRRRRNA
jgi:hypothetical protein